MAGGVNESPSDSLVALTVQCGGHNVDLTFSDSAEVRQSADAEPAAEEVLAEAEAEPVAEVEAQKEEAADDHEANAQPEE